MEAPRRGSPKSKSSDKPITIYNSNTKDVVIHVFGRVTGKSIFLERLKSYAEVRCQYHLSSEDKFLNGQFLDRGRTGRRVCDCNWYRVDWERG